jgi:circadian clock protein KaiC
MEEIIKTKTGIVGLDKALNGGVPEGNVVLVSGGAGTGKSTLCLQIAVQGAIKFKEKGLYISTEQNKKELNRQAGGFNWNLNDLEEANLLKIVYFDVTEGDSFLEKMTAFIKEFQPTRIVIDSLTTLTDSMLVSGVLEDKGFSMVQIAETINPIPRTEKIMNKTLLYHLFKEIKLHNITTFLTTELPEDHKKLSADGVSEFIADGVLEMQFLGIGGMDSRSLRIRKMRYTDHEKNYIPYEIKSTGLELSLDDMSSIIMK